MSIAARCVHGVKLCVIPSHHNNHHPLALRHGPLAFMSAMLLTVKIAALGLVALTPATADLSTITTDRIIQLTNVERQKAGVGHVTVNSKLSNAALQKGQDMLAKDYFAHISPSGITPWFWMSKVGYTYSIAGENLAIDFTSAEDVVDAWMNSPSHRENLLLPDYTDIGIGVVTGEFQGGTSTIVVQMFGKPLNAPVSAPAATPTPSATPAVKASTSTKPSPSATPTPTPTFAPASPAPSVPTTPAPRIPRIALSSPLVASSVDLSLAGDPDSEVHILLNSQEHDVVTLSSQGTAQQTISLKDFPDGTVTIKAYATNSSKVASALSEPLQFRKDTNSPSLENVGISFALSPLTDSANIAVNLKGTDADSVVVAHDDVEYPLLPNAWHLIPIPPAAFTIQLEDGAKNVTTIPVTTLAPQFSIQEDQSFPKEATFYWQVSRRVAASIFAFVFVLLCLAIFIRIRIQNIPLITHASLVLLLALVLFMF